jgi:hypothetical protein
MSMHSVSQLAALVAWIVLFCVVFVMVYVTRDRM